MYVTTSKVLPLYLGGVQNCYYIKKQNTHTHKQKQNHKRKKQVLGPEPSWQSVHLTQTGPAYEFHTAALHTCDLSTQEDQFKAILGYREFHTP